jgi:Protein of unknown function (DUF3108)
MMTALSGAFALLVALAPRALQQAPLALPVSEAAPSAQRAPDGAAAEAPAKVPFGVGERAVYDVRFGPLKVGSGSMEVSGVENVRGREAYRTSLKIKGGTFFYKVNDLFESWIDTRSLASLRFHQDQEEGGRDREKVFEIFPERQMYKENDKPEKPSVRQPLDDGSFLYFVRTVPLEVGQTYRFDRYFRPDRNPVTLRVLRKERIKVPAGEFDAVVVQPVIKTKGIFSENGEAQVWLTDDERRIMLQMKSKLSFGSLNLYLRSYRPPAEGTASPGPG